MASNITPGNIDGTYPIAGIDNDTQGFRTNFTNTSTNLASAKLEIEDLQAKAVLKAPLTGEGSTDNDMLGEELIAATILDIREKVVNLGTVSGGVTIDHQAGHYQYLTTSGSVVLTFTNFSPTSLSRVRVEIDVQDIGHTLTLPVPVLNGVDFVDGLVGTNPPIITFAAVGVFVFEFYSYDNSTFTINDLTRAALPGDPASVIEDDDGDTQILVEDGPNEDIIRFNTGDNIANYPAKANILLLSSAAFTLAMADANVNGIDGGVINLTSGAGQEVADGGDINLTAGASGTGSTGVGGTITLTGGAAASTNDDGGDIVLTPGAGAGSGNDGAINITQTTAPTSTTDKLYNVSGALFFNGVDLSTGSDPTTLMDTDGDTLIQVEEDDADEDIIRFDTGASQTNFPAQPNALIFSSAEFTLLLPNANVVDQVGSAISLTSGDGNDLGAGGAITITAGDTGSVGDQSQDGGKITLQAGNSITTSGFASTGRGGDVDILAGDMVRSGSGYGYGGDVNITAGYSKRATNGSVGGAINITGGHIRSSDNDRVVGGPINITGGLGDGENTERNDGGNVVIAGGIGEVNGEGDGGFVILVGGVGGDAGGNVTITGGQGYGTDISSDGDGGDVFITGGLGHATRGQGGDIILTPGVGTAGADDGAIVINTSTAPVSTTDKLYNVAGALTWNGDTLTGTLTDADSDTRIQVEEGTDEDIIRFDTGAGIAGFPAQANALLFSSGQFTLALPIADVATTTGGAINLTTGTGNTSGDGGDFNITTGAGGATTGDGGAITITSGDGSNYGGAINIQVGTSNSGVGRDLTLIAGESDYTGGDAFGGDILLTAGEGLAGADNSYGGRVIITGGAGIDQAAQTGDVIITGGANTVQNGSEITLTGGTGGSDNKALGGDVNLTGGVGGTDTSYGGAIRLTGGTGSYYGGHVFMTAGNHVDDGSVADGLGGDCYIAGGNSDDGIGGSVRIAGGDAGNIDADGGNIVLTMGAGSGSGSTGAIRIVQSTAPTTTTDKLYNEGGALTWNGSILATGATGAFTEDATSNSIFSAGAGPVLQAGGTFNFFALDNAGLVTTTGDHNIAIGINAMDRAATSTGNIAIGYFSGTAFSLGNYNIAIGYESFRDVGGGAMIGLDNIAIGRETIHNSVSKDCNLNIAIGRRSLLSLTIGDNNIAIGEAVFLALTEGIDNIGIGSDTGASITDGINNICIGQAAGPTANQSSKLFINQSESDTPLIGGDFATPIVTIAGDFVVTGNNTGTPIASSITGGDATTATNPGGAINFTGGVGNTTGSGGGIALTGGVGGASDGDGGTLTLTGGAGGVTDSDGGDIVLTPGPLAGSGNDGAINITQTTAPSTTTDRLYNLGGVLTWNAQALLDAADIGVAVLAEQAIGITDNDLLEVDGSPNSAEYARFTAAGLEGRTEAEFKADFNLEIGTDVAAVTPTATTAELAAIADAINTGALKVAGFMVFNTDDGAPVWAVGSDDNSVWNDATGSLAHTPIA